MVLEIADMMGSICSNLDLSVENHIQYVVLCSLAGKNMVLAMTSLCVQFPHDSQVKKITHFLIMWHNIMLLANVTSESCVKSLYPGHTAGLLQRTSESAV
jgi:hypothetical protein